MEHFYSALEKSQEKKGLPGKRIKLQIVVSREIQLKRIVRGSKWPDSFRSFQIPPISYLGNNFPELSVNTEEQIAKCSNRYDTFENIRLAGKLH